MKVSVLAALVAGFVTPSLAAAKPADALLPASLCVTYQTTYLVTAPGPDATDGRPGRPPTGRPPPGTAVPSSTPSDTVAAEAVIFSVVPLGDNKRGLEKRASGGFLNLAQDGVKNTCTDASPFTLAGGELFADGYPIWATPSWTSVLFNGLGESGSFGAVGEEVITRTFSVNSGGYLRWRNETFLNGEAYFCQLVSSESQGQLYIVFSAEESDFPVGCQPASLKTYRGKLGFCLLHTAPVVTLS